MKKKSYYEVVDENGKTIAIRKTDKGIKNWKLKHKVQKCGSNYSINGKPIWIDYVDSVSERGVIVNLSELIESKLENLKKAELFRMVDIDWIMDDIEAIISGNVSEEWMEEFVNALV